MKTYFKYDIYVGLEKDKDGNPVPKNKVNDLTWWLREYFPNGFSINQIRGFDGEVLEKSAHIMVLSPRSCDLTITKIVEDLETWLNQREVLVLRTEVQAL